MKNYNNQAKWITFKYSVIEFLRKYKFWLIFLGSLILIAMLTGIFTSIKLFNLDNDIDLTEYSIKTMMSGEIYSFGYFLLRLVSCLIVVGLLVLFAMNKFVYFLGVSLLVYRAYLITLNCTFIIIKCGVGGILNVFLILLPCQLLFLSILTILFVLFIGMFKQKKIGGCGEYNNLILWLLILLLVIDIVEILLLIVFKSTTILII